MSSEQKTKLPGFGLPLDYLPLWDRLLEENNERFPHAIADFFATEGITCREQRMLEFINQITDKPWWTEKIYDEKIVSKWRTEACGTRQQQETSDQHLSEKCFEFVGFWTQLLVSPGSLADLELV